MTAAQPRARRSIPAGLRFAWATGVGLFGVLLLGWLTALRAVMHALLITLGSSVLVPFLLVLGGIAVLAAASLASALIVDDATLRSRAQASDSAWLRRYFAQLARQRQNPLAWGLIAGCGLGIVGVWLVLAALVIPLETRTLGVLHLAQARLATSTLHPNRAADGLLRSSAWNPTAGAGPDEPVLDAFGHPIARDAGGAAGSFTLRSLGLDGIASSDDLCANGQAGSSPTAASDPLRFVEDLRAERLSWSAQLAALDGARCPSR